MVEDRSIKSAQLVMDSAVTAGLKRKAYPGHDPKTCRVYKCGLCAALKGEK